MDERRMHKADFVTSVVLIAFSITVIVLSIRMPRLEHREINPYTIPGLVPGFLGVIIGTLSVALFIRSTIHGGFRLGAGEGSSIGTWIKSDEARRIGITVILSAVYALGMIGRLNYIVATLIYVFVFILLFEWKRGEPIGAHRRVLILAAIEAVPATLVIAAVFRYLFLVDLP